MDYYADGIGDILINDAIFPSQWADSFRRVFTPEQQLMLAILNDALHLAIGREPTSNKQRRDQWEARQWLAAPRQPGPGLSVHDVCDALELDAGWVRARLNAGTIVRIPKHMHVAGLGTQRRKMTVRHSEATRQPVF